MSHAKGMELQGNRVRTRRSPNTRNAKHRASAAEDRKTVAGGFTKNLGIAVGSDGTTGLAERRQTAIKRDAASVMREWHNEKIETGD